MSQQSRYAAAVATVVVFGCGAPAPTPPARGNGGTSANGGTSPIGPNSGGTSGGSAQSGGAGGASSSGGFAGAVAGTAGTAPGAGMGGIGGSGDASGGTAGTAPTAGTGGSSSEVTGSKGCGNSNPPTGDLTATVNGAQAPYVVTLPQGYQPNTPVPLVFGFHGRGRTHVQFQTVDASNIQQELGSKAVMAYLKSQGGTGWEMASERELNVEFFELVLERLLAEACIDTSRIFAVGHSSGAHFTHVVACRFGDKLRGIGAVAGYLPEQNCVENVAAIVIHGATDNQVANSSGREARDFYVNRNGCTMTTAPGAVSPCVEYQGCDEGLPVEWCEHTEPTYDNTNHGWPSFASEAIADLFWNLP